MYILEGDADIVDDLDGTVHHLVADTVILLPFGWSGRWVIRDTIRKVYLHTDPVNPVRGEVHPSVFADSGVTLGAELPDPSRLGGPEGRELLVFDGPDGRCAIAGVAPGTFTVEPDGTGRYVHVIAGSGAIVDADGTQRPFGAGSAFALPRGWAGDWRIDDALRLLYVRTPGAESA
jgi:uncharacterized cupin superfamily protein